MESLLDQIQSTFATQLGNEIPSFQLNDQMHRNKSLWAIGTQWDYKGNQYCLVNYGDWKRGTKSVFKNFDPRQQTKQFNKKSRDNIQAMQAIQKLEAEKKNKKCIEKWKPIFDESKSGPLHEYCSSKKLTSNYNARTHENGSLLIPAYDENGFVGVQMIFESEGKFEKRFSTGIKLSGSFSFIGNIRNADMIYVCEGFATAATVHNITGAAVLITFNCNNIYPAVQTLRKINKFSKLIICADNDRGRVNPQTGKPENIGIIKAKQAARKLSNCIVRFPQFPKGETDGTDYNDLFMIEGEDETADQLSYASGDFVEVINLGRQGKKFYYFSTETKQVVDLSADQHAKNYFLTMADGQYWADLYGYKKDKEGQPTTKPDWDMVQEKVLSKQRAIGFFNPKNIRGYGCWFDNKKLVVNLGDSLLVDNARTEKIESKYLYESGDPLDIDLENPLTNAEAARIPKLFKKLNYKTPGDFIYLCAWIGQAQIFGALDWRFQAWLTGSRGSGKTEILRMISGLTFNTEIYQSVTAASIRQHLKSNAVPMIIDEAEPNNLDERRRMDGVIELIRQCSSRLNTKTLRGTATGTALEYNVNSVFLLSSIQTYLPTMADKSRFFEIEMADNKNQDSESWIQIQNEYAELSDFAPRLFARMVRLIPVIRENIKTTKRLLTQSNLVDDKRAADQIAVAIAVYSAFFSDTDIDPKFIVDAAEALNLGRSEYENANGEDEAEKCFDEILDSIIDRSTMITVGQCVNERNDLRLNPIGMRVFHDGRVFIQTGNVELRRVLKDSMYSNLRSILKRHPKFLDIGVSKINNRSVKGIFLDASL